jgi:DNA repair protein RecO (recombination protein O)
MRQERLYRTEGIVLREMDYGEADRILTLLTPGGKLNALARGIRKPTSRKVGHLGLFYRSQLMVARGRNLDTITQAQSLEEFEGMRGDLLRFTYACYIAELVERFAQEGEDSAPLYELVVEALRRLAEEQDLRLWTRYFELRVLAYSGYQPELFACVHCHEAIQPQTNFFSAEQGGLLCQQCGQNDPRAKAISLNAQKVLRYLQTHDAGDVGTLRVGRATHTEIESLLHAYLEYTLERELKSVVFLQRLQRELRAAEERDVETQQKTGL